MKTFQRINIVIIDLLILMLCILIYSVKAQTVFMMATPKFIMENITYYLLPSESNVPVSIIFEYPNPDEMNKSTVKYQYYSDKSCGLDREDLNRLAQKYNYDKIYYSHYNSITSKDYQTSAEALKQILAVQSRIAGELHTMNKGNLKNIWLNEGGKPVRVVFHYATSYARLFAAALFLLALSFVTLIIALTVNISRLNIKSDVKNYTSKDRKSLYREILLGILSIAVMGLICLSIILFSTKTIGILLAIFIVAICLALWGGTKGGGLLGGDWI